MTSAAGKLLFDDIDRWARGLNETQVGIYDKRLAAIEAEVVRAAMIRLGAWIGARRGKVTLREIEDKIAAFAGGSE